MTKPFWLSWYAEKPFGEFELNTPWWVSGERMADDAATVVAAVKAADEAAAREAVYAAYDDRPAEIEFRFVTEQEPGWSPFSGRFPRAEWMPWDAQTALIGEPPRQPAADIPADFPADPLDVSDGFLASNGIRIRALGEDGEETYWAFGHVDPDVFIAAVTEKIRADETEYNATLQRAGIPPWTGPTEAEDLDSGSVEQVTWETLVPYCSTALSHEDGDGDDGCERCTPDECISEFCAPWGVRKASDKTPEGAFTFPATVLYG